MVEGNDSVDDIFSVVSGDVNKLSGTEVIIRPVVEEVGNGKVMTLTYGEVNGVSNFTGERVMVERMSRRGKMKWCWGIILGFLRPVFCRQANPNPIRLYLRQIYPVVEGTTYFYRTNAVNSVGFPKSFVLLDLCGRWKPGL